MKKIRVLIVDDIAETREHLAKLLSFEPDIEVIGAAASGEEALEMSARLNPDILLMDINMPGMNGIEATRRLLESLPDAVVLLCSTYSAADLPAGAATCGAQAYVDKEDLAPEVLTQVWASRYGSE